MKLAKLSNLGEAIDRLGFEKIAPLEALAGDIIAIESVEEWGGIGLGIADGSGRLIAFANGICDHAPVTVASAAWRSTVVAV